MWLRGIQRRDGSPPAPIDVLPPNRDLLAECDDELMSLFLAQAAIIQDMANNLLKHYSVRLSHELIITAMNNYIHKASMLADKLGIADEPLLASKLPRGDEPLSKSVAGDVVPNQVGRGMGDGGAS